MSNMCNNNSSIEVLQKRFLLDEKVNHRRKKLYEESKALESSDSTIRRASSVDIDLETLEHASLSKHEKQMLGIGPEIGM